MWKRTEIKINQRGSSPEVKLLSVNTGRCYDGTCTLMAVGCETVVQLAVAITKQYLNVEELGVVGGYSSVPALAAQARDLGLILSQ